MKLIDFEDLGHLICWLTIFAFNFEIYVNKVEFWLFSIVKLRLIVGRFALNQEDLFRSLWVMTQYR